MPQIGIQLDDYEATTCTLRLYLSRSGLLETPGGYVLTEIANGYFEANVTELLIGDYGATVKIGNDLIWVDGTLYAGQSIVDRAPPSPHNKLDGHEIHVEIAGDCIDISLDH